MASFYTNMKATATKLLAKFGSPAAYVIERTAGATFDPVTGDYTGGTVTATTLVGVATRLPKSLVDGARILSTDNMYIFDSAFEILPSDIMVDGSIKMRIIEVQKIKPADTVLIYKVVARG